MQSLWTAIGCFGGVLAFCLFICGWATLVEPDKEEAEALRQELASWSWQRRLFQARSRVGGRLLNGSRLLKQWRRHPDARRFIYAAAITLAIALTAAFLTGASH